MNALFTGFSPDALYASLILVLICAVIAIARQIEIGDSPNSADSLPFPPPSPQHGESPSVWLKPNLPQQMSSIEAIHRLAEARSDLMSSRRRATPQEVEAAAIAHTAALTNYLNAVTRELRT